MLTGVPTYSVLANPQVLDECFAQAADRARLARRYATLSQAALFEPLDLEGEDKLAVSAGGWETLADLGEGTSLEGSSATARFGEEIKVADVKKKDGEDDVSDDSEDSEDERSTTARKKKRADSDASGDVELTVSGAKANRAKAK
jgi:hypothetical protein